MIQKNISKLVDRYLNGNASEAESKLVETFLDELKNGPVRQLSPEEEASKEALLLKHIHTGMKQRNGVLVSMSKRWRAAVAVAAIFIITMSVWLVASNKPSVKNGEIKLANKDITAPNLNRATVTLADGSQVYLDNTQSGQLAVQGNIKLVKLSDGRIAYQSANGEAINELEYNTLSNPRGSKVIDMMLSDGSHVWLNSGSSITYPVAFIGNERKITVEGEAYFEVAHDAKKPFIVSKGDVNVKVLGTHFNVNGYNDEEALLVTLLEGSVEVKAGTSNSAVVKLKPGQQAVHIHNAPLAVRNDVDVDETMAWKNGMFLLDNTDLPTIMRQVSRWYDVSVVYASKIPNTKFVGGVSKNLPLSKILELLKSNGIETELEGKTLTVK